MEGRIVFLSVLVMSLVMTQIQVEAKSCCPSTTARNIYNTCRLTGASRPVCASLSGCIIVNGSCRPPNTHEILENSGGDVNEYYKLGCVSSVCNALNTLQNSYASEIVNGAVDQCTKACMTFCTKDSMIAAETA